MCLCDVAYCAVTSVTMALAAYCYVTCEFEYLKFRQAASCSSKRLQPSHNCAKMLQIGSRLKRPVSRLQFFGAKEHIQSSLPSSKIVLLSDLVESCTTYLTYCSPDSTIV